MLCPINLSYRVIGACRAASTDNSVWEIDVRLFHERVDETEALMRMRKSEPIKILEQRAADNWIQRQRRLISIGGLNMLSAVRSICSGFIPTMQFIEKELNLTLKALILSQAFNAVKWLNDCRYSVINQ